MALSLAIVIGISLGSYLALCNQSLRLSTRTLQLSRARMLAETGLEEALWSLNAAANPNATISSAAWSNASWNASPTVADRSCTITGYNLGNGATGELTITIKNFDGPKAAVFSPIAAAAVPAPNVTVTASITAPGVGVFTKTLTATTKPAPLFPNAVGITNSYNGRITFNSGGLVDSWDSDYLGNVPLGPLPASTPNRDYNPSTGANTLYPGTSPLTTPATVLPSPYSNASPTGTYPNASFNYAAIVAAPNITLNNAEIRGYAVTFGNPINTTGGSKVTAPPPPGTPAPPPNISTSRVGKSAFVPDFAISPPTGSYDTVTLASTSLTSGATLTIGRTDGVLEQHQVGSALTISNGSTLKVQGPVVIRVDDDFNLWLAAKIVILPGARLEMFVSGNIQIGGASGSTAQFDNQTNEPKRLALYSTNQGTRTFIYYSTQKYCGVMYSASNGSKIEFQSSPDIQGAILAKYNIEFDAGTTPGIHYDTALQYLPKGWFKGVTTPFMIVQVTETITP